MASANVTAVDRHLLHVNLSGLRDGVMRAATADQPETYVTCAAYRVAASPKSAATLATATTA
jgi:hypothetical protein